MTAQEELADLLHDVELGLGCAYEGMIKNPVYLLSPVLRQSAGERAQQALDKLLRLKYRLSLDPAPGQAKR